MEPCLLPVTGSFQTLGSAADIFCYISIYIYRDIYSIRIYRDIIFNAHFIEVENFCIEMNEP